MVTKSYICNTCYESLEREQEMNDTSHPDCPVCGRAMDRNYSDMGVARPTNFGYGFDRR